jgi:hypothetical protein
MGEKGLLFNGVIGVSPSPDSGVPSCMACGVSGSPSIMLLLLLLVLLLLLACWLLLESVCVNS